MRKDTHVGEIRHACLYECILDNLMEAVELITDGLSAIFSDVTVFLL